MDPRQLCSCGQCTRCKNREKGRRFREANPDYYSRANRARYHADPELARLRRSEYYARNREKVCATERERRSRLTPEENLATRERARAADPGKYRAQIVARGKRWRDAHRTEYQAQKKLQRAVKSGKVVKQQCEVCGADAEGHHDDYSKPLDVRWLCRKHHKALHAAT